ncbi:amidohydrolase family protein [Gimibacter soli]|uniref:Amidohydrolase family protein n=1 Tax=Gimibacter soli TaxID=3024400 RepID=A0AAF0BLZ5_9PROT|nr:amidohydrolase family protein [Gimibacter soli]WCL54797.1 amidohydrolase family protein [Gimibacter soli]
MFAKAFLVTAVLAGVLAPASAADVTIYRDATIIDGKGGASVPHMAVIVEGETISAVTPVADLSATEMDGAKVVDLSGAYLMPGLIDSHQHMATPPDHPRALAQMRRDLYGGITAVRIMADDLRAVGDYARASAQGEIAAPDIYYAALMAGPDFFDDPRTAAAAKGVKPGTAPWMQAITPDTDMPLAIARAKGTSAIGVKLYDNLHPAELKRITAEAHKQGMFVWAHGMVFPSAPEDVVAAGVDVISHTCYLAYQVMNPRPTTYKDRRPVETEKLQGGDNPVMAKIFRDMAAKGIALDATIRVYREMDDRYAATPKMKQPYCTADLAAILTKQAYDLGVKIVAGTDVVPPREAAFPALYDELVLLNEKVGMPAGAVIRAATYEGARILGQDGTFGTIEAGKRADFIVTGSDPLASLANVRDIRFTVKRGKRYDRADYKGITAAEMPDEE